MIQPPVVAWGAVWQSKHEAGGLSKRKTLIHTHVLELIAIEPVPNGFGEELILWKQNNKNMFCVVLYLMILY